MITIKPIMVGLIQVMIYYKITVNKILYTKTTRGTKKEFKRILTTETTEKDLVNKMLQLKKLYKDSSYNIEFVKI